MDLKNEVENEVLLAILTKKRQAKGIDGENSRELISKIKGALKDKHREVAVVPPANSTPEPEYIH